MRKNKIIFFILGLIITTLCTITIANAEAIATKLTIKSTNYTNTKIKFPETFHVKKTSAGKYVYCLTYARKTPSSGISYTRDAFVSDAGKAYILKKAYDNVKNNDDFFIYQTALWIYMQDKGLMTKSNSVATFKTKVNSSSSATATKIKSIVAKAKTASKMDTTNPTIKLTTSDTKLTLDGDSYVSKKIKLTSSEKKYQITFVNAPDNTTYKVSNGYLYIYVPKASISKISNEFEVKVSNSKIIYKSYDFKPSSSSYQMMAATFKYTKTASASLKLTITKNVELSIDKIDADSKKSLSGAKIVVKDEKNKEIASFTSKNTAYVIKNLTQGTYTIEETQAPDGYILSKQIFKFTVDESGKITNDSGEIIKKVALSNHKNQVYISKQDITNNTELPGAKLVLKSEDGEEIDSWTSDFLPHKIEALKAGTYILSETTAPKGYVVTKETIQFTINKYGKIIDKNGKTIDKIVMYNTPQKEMNIRISKQDITTSKELPGATLTVLDKNGKVVETWVSEETEHTIQYIIAGTYTLKETVAPKGYVLSEEKIEFTIDKNGKLTDSDGKVIDKVIMYNKKENKPLEVAISKQDITTSKELPGATLTVKEESGKVIDTWTSTSEEHVIKNLAAGTYTLTEVQAPDGYTLSTETITFVINETGKITDGNGNIIEKVIMFNKPIKKIDVTISKQDITTSKELPGATLTVKDESGKVIDTWTSTSEEHVIKNLVAGTYTLTEVQAPDGYILSTETITFVINDGKLQNKDQQNIDKVIMYNEKEHVGEKVSIIKQDSITHENIKGAHLEVKDEAGNLIDSWVSMTEAHTLELKAGTYILTETQAPDGYKIGKETITFHITEAGKLTDENGQTIHNIIVNNTPTKEDTGSVNISKQDITNGKELPGAHLVVKDKNGNVIDEWISTNKPHLIENLVLGSYTLNEVIAPNGYILSDETITFTVKADGKIDTVVMYNQPQTAPSNPDTPTIDKPSEKPNNIFGIEIEVENTSSSRNLITSIIGGITAMVGTISLVIRKKILFK